VLDIKPNVVEPQAVEASFDPYGRLLRMLMPSLRGVIVHDGYSNLVWASDEWDLSDEPELINGVLDGLTEYYTALGRNAIKLGVDMIRVGDDIGAQQSMMLSPKSWRAFAKPRFQHMFAEFKKENPEIFFKFHSCGDYSPILPDEIELGAHLSGLMQPTGGLKDHAAIKSKFGADIVLAGGFDVQRILPRGQVEDVRKGVFECMKNLGPGGGYIFCPSHYIMADVPIQNIMAMFEAQRDYGVYGKYPLN